MDNTFFTNLPSEIIIDILSKLPIKSIIICKCVCKSWLKLLESPEFAKSHLSRSVPGLIVFQCEMYSSLYKIFEFVDEIALEHPELHFNPIMNFDKSLSSHKSNGMQGSVNGLLLLREINTQPNGLYICNQITREYIKLPYPHSYQYPSIVTYGFGLSRVSGQYKVVRIFHECICDKRRSECRVYTLGTGSWRTIDARPSYDYSCRSTGAFMNGNLHWLVGDLNGSHLISWFDLETELFDTVSPPPCLPERSTFLGDVVVFEDCLCLCDNTSDNEIVIWIMKEYGVEKSWVKEYVISKLPDRDGKYYVCIYPLKVFKNGGILLLWGDFYLFYYSNKTKTLSNIDMFELHSPGLLEARLHVSSFLSLKSFVFETVIKFLFFVIQPYQYLIN